ncbi:MAG: hypothetical protein ACI8WT_002527 [Clostridium sp.]|jgi:hypothetical protein
MILKVVSITFCDEYSTVGDDLTGGLLNGKKNRCT